MLIASKIRNWFRSPKIGDLVWFETLQYKIVATTRYKTSFMRSISEDGSAVVSHLCATGDLEWMPQYACWGLKQRVGAIPNPSSVTNG